MKNKFLPILFAVFALLMMTTACAFETIPKSEQLAYNAELIIDYCENERRIMPTHNGCFSRNFLRENLVRGTYLNEDYDSDSPSSEEYIFYGTLPESITHIVKTETEYNHIFESTYRYLHKNSIDFEKEMLIVYVYSGANGIDHYLSDVCVNGEELIIKYKYKIVTNDVGTVPKRGVMVLKMDNLEVETVRFSSLGRI